MERSHVLTKKIWTVDYQPPEVQVIATFKSAKEAIDFVNDLVRRLAFVGMADINTGHVFLGTGDDSDDIEGDRDSYVTFDIDDVPVVMGKGIYFKKIADDIGGIISTSDESYADKTMKGSI